MNVQPGTAVARRSVVSAVSADTVGGPRKARVIGNVVAVVVTVGVSRARRAVVPCVRHHLVGMSAVAPTIVVDHAALGRHPLVTLCPQACRQTVLDEGDLAVGSEAAAEPSTAGGVGVTTTRQHPAAAALPAAPRRLMSAPTALRQRISPLVAPLVQAPSVARTGVVVLPLARQVRATTKTAAPPSLRRRRLGCRRCSLARCTPAPGPRRLRVHHRSPTAAPKGV